MRKVHFKQVGGRWFSYYDRPSSEWSLPITLGNTLPECRDRLIEYKPRILERHHA